MWLIRILSLFPAVCIQQSATPNRNTNPNHIPNPNRNPNRNITVIIDPQIDHRDTQIVTTQIRPAPHFVVCQFCPDAIPTEWWRFGVAVTRWSWSTQLLYIEPC